MKMRQDLQRITIFLTIIYQLSLTKCAINVNSRIIVVGGGVSGLAATSRLVSLGFKNVSLLEANNRLGGRINTIPFNNSYLELGAQWVHGQGANPVFLLLKSLNEIDFSTTFFKPDGFYYQATQDGQSYQDGTFADYVFESTDGFFETIYDSILNINENSQASIGSYLAPLYNDFLAKLGTKYKNFNRTLVNSIYNAALQDQKSNYGCNSFDDLTAVGVNEYTDYPGEENTNLKNGYFKLIDFLKANISTSSIMLNKTISLIDYTNVNQIVVSGFDTNTKAKFQYNADIVLVTVSLGVLKQNYKTLFNPYLSPTKVKAIEKLGFGTMNKIFVVFPNNVFKYKEQGLQFFWRSDLPISLPNSDKKWNLTKNQFYKSFANFDVLPKFPNILYGDLTGSDSIASESLSEDCFIDVIYEMFSKFFPKLKLPKPIRVIKSNWTSNRFTMGSYSFIKIGSYPSDVENLASSIQNRIFFSGEATDSRYIGTVHGGFITGVANANKIANLIRKSG